MDWLLAILIFIITATVTAVVGKFNNGRHNRKRDCENMTTRFITNIIINQIEILICSALVKWKRLNKYI